MAPLVPVFSLLPVGGMPPFGTNQPVVLLLKVLAVLVFVPPSRNGSRPRWLP